MNFLRKSHVALGIVLCAVIGIMANVHSGTSASGLPDLTSQDVMSLDRRISLLEQRFYSIESSINRLQQSVLMQRSPGPQPSTRDQEINLLHEEIQRLSTRLSELECGVVKLDQRTLSVTDARKSPGAKSTDPCRLNPSTPVRLSTRP